MELLDVYVEITLADAGPESRWPGIAAHLRDCYPCADDLAGLPRRRPGLTRLRRPCARAKPGWTVFSDRTIGWPRPVHGARCCVRPSGPLATTARSI
jgi:hypothetical protein